MRVRLVLSLAALAAAGFGSALFAPVMLGGDCAAAQAQVAQTGYPAIPKPSVRRAGELEDWSDTDKKSPAKATSGKKTGGVAAKAQPKPAADKPARDPEDGGIPLPRSRAGGETSPVGIDGTGKVGTSLKF